MLPKYLYKRRMYFLRLAIIFKIMCVCMCVACCVSPVSVLIVGISEKKINYLNKKLMYNFN